jgi:FKBP-type peptidyl-prolyl cis-trans isomerase SlyD
MRFVRLLNGLSIRKKSAMNPTTLQIADNMVVNLTYVLAISEEEMPSGKERRVSIQFLQGHKQVVPGLEQALYGMSVGEEKDIVVDATNGYGEINPRAVRTLPLKNVPLFAKAIAGQQLHLRQKSSGKRRQALVVDVHPDTIVLNFNHPLAGKTLHFHVQVVDLRQATAAELAAGKIEKVTRPKRRSAMFPYLNH